MNNQDKKYDVMQYDRAKTKVLKYVLYQKRTVNEVYLKFEDQIEIDMLEDIIEYLKQEGYLNDLEFVNSKFQNYINLNHYSVFEIKGKLLNKGINKNLIDKYIEENEDVLNEYEQKSIKHYYSKLNKDEEKIYQYLYRKGFKNSNIEKVREDI